MLTRQRLLRSRPELNCGTAHIFWYMLDEHMHFGVILGLCVRMAPLKVSSNVLILFSNSRSRTSRNSTSGITSFRKALQMSGVNIVDRQIISRDTPFLRCQAERQSALLDSEFE